MTRLKSLGSKLSYVSLCCFFHKYMLISPKTSLIFDLTWIAYMYMELGKINKLQEARKLTFKAEYSSRNARKKSSLLEIRVFLFLFLLSFLLLFLFSSCCMVLYVGQKWLNFLSLFDFQRSLDKSSSLWQLMKPFGPIEISHFTQ